MLVSIAHYINGNMVIVSSQNNMAYVNKYILPGQEKLTS